MNLLEYPVTEVGVLGLWRFIAGGTLRGAGQGHTRTRVGSKIKNRRGRNREKKSSQVGGRPGDGQKGRKA